MHRFLVIAVLVGLTGCSATDIFVSGRVNWPPRAPEPLPERVPVPERMPERYPAPPRHAGKAFIPPGHLPPPGACKVWTPGKPPGHQPPPETCDNAFYYVQPGQMVVRRDEFDPNMIEVSKAYVYNHRMYFDVEYYLAKKN